MNGVNDGGPAFPQQLSDGQRERGCSADFGYGGMSLRDWFAGQALSTAAQDTGGTVASAAKELGIPIGEYDGKKHWPKLVAKSAYAYADAMLAEREKGGGK